MTFWRWLFYRWTGRGEITELRDRAVTDATEIARLRFELECADLALSCRARPDWSGLSEGVKQIFRSVHQNDVGLSATRDQTRANWRNNMAKFGLDLEDEPTVWAVLMGVELVSFMASDNGWVCPHARRAVLVAEAGLAVFVPETAR